MQSERKLAVRLKIRILINGREQPKSIHLRSFCTPRPAVCPNTRRTAFNPRRLGGRKQKIPSQLHDFREIRGRLGADDPSDSFQNSLQVGAHDVEHPADPSFNISRKSTLPAFIKGDLPTGVKAKGILCRTRRPGSRERTPEDRLRDRSSVLICADSSGSAGGSWESCKPNSVPTRRSVDVIYLCGRYPGPDSLACVSREPRRGPLFGLAPGEVFLALTIARQAVGSYPAVSPLPATGLRRRQAVCVFCGTVCQRRLASMLPAARPTLFHSDVATGMKGCRFPRPRALWSSDFPPAERIGQRHPALPKPFEP